MPSLVVASRGRLLRRRPREVQRRTSDYGQDRYKEKENGARAPLGAVSRAGAQAHPEGEAEAQGKGASMSEPEHYANATLGFRQWYFSLGSEGKLPLLEGLVRYGFSRPRYLWDLTSPNHAECLRLKFNPDSFSEEHGEVPRVRCSCGFYAHGRRDSSNSETTVHVVGGVVAGWGNLELHERGFKCGVAKILALFAPPPRKMRSHNGEQAQKSWMALRNMCADNAIPLLLPDALRDDEEVRRYAWERDLVLLEDQLVT